MPLGELKIVFLGHPGVKFQDTELGVVPNFMFLAYTHLCKLNILLIIIGSAVVKLKTQNFNVKPFSIGFLGHPGGKLQDTELGVVPNFMFLAYTYVLGVRNQIPFDEFKVERH